MSRPGIRFVGPMAPELRLNVRADVALFVGLVKVREGKIPDWALQQWHDNGLPGDGDEPPTRPVRLQSFAQFNVIFDPSGRNFDTKNSSQTVASSLGLAVRSFFEEGGICCYVVRCGDPLPLLPAANEKNEDFEKTRAALIERIIPRESFRPDDLSTWRGLGHALGLEDVSMVLLPDLPDLCANAPGLLRDPFVASAPSERFRLAGVPVTSVNQPAQALQQYTTVRLNSAARALWCKSIAAALAMLGGKSGGVCRRDIQLIASLPLPVLAESERERSPTIDDFMMNLTADAKSQLQLTYPWVKTAASAELPEGLQASDGIVAGILARNALTRGAFKSASGLPSLSALVFSPALSAADVNKAIHSPDDRIKTDSWLGDELTLIGRDDQGILLLSDTMLSSQKSTRAASVQRLSGIVLRAAKLVGEDLIFESNLPSTWTRLRHRLEDYLTELWRLGAFDGENVAEAFFVRCGPSTMTQNDIDAGRLIAEISYQSMQPIERITVTLELGVAQPASLRAA